MTSFDIFQQIVAPILTTNLVQIYLKWDIIFPHESD